ncbi:MAG TPA: hypothetical protein VFV50_06850 [Bdellovibrionales bacterium]|nr:hypothetical protein [Bdellovibrionales bacterium]
MKSNWLEKVKAAIKDHQVLVALLVLSGLTATIVELQSSAPTKTKSFESPATHIPDGFVLVPIEVQNPEALDSILGNFGVVDLFASHPGGSRRIARRVKILRAPLNPNHFAVLAPEDEAPLLVREPGPVTVAIQNPKSAGTDFVRPSRKRSRLHVENLE